MEALALSSIHDRLGAIVLQADRSLAAIRRRERLAGRLRRARA